MAAGRIVVPPYFPARNRDFDLLSGAKLYVYDNLTTDKANIYTDEALTVLSANPVIANSSGQFPAIWAQAGTEAEPVLYSVSVTTSTGASPGNPFNFDNYRPSVDWETATLALAEAAADAAALSAAEAAADLVSVESIYEDILDIEATGSDAAAIAARAKLDGSNFTGSQPTQFRTAIAAVGLVELAASAGSALVGFLQAGISAVARAAQDKMRDSLDVRDFGVVGSGDEGAKIQAALNRAAVSGAELVWPAGSYSTSVALSCLAVRIRFVGPVTLTYTSATHINRVLTIVPNGALTSLRGKLVVDGNNKANVGVYIENAIATATDLVLGDIEARNCRMVSGSAFNSGSYGIYIAGNYSQLTADRLWADTISRAAGTGSIGNFGTVGVSISRSAGYAPKSVVISVIGANNITTDDAPGSAACVDTDGVQIFQNDETGAALSVEEVNVTNAQGRGFKGQSYRSVSVAKSIIARSIEGITGGSTEVAFQYGEGVMGQVNIEYSGVADTVHVRGTTPVATFTSTLRAAGYGVTGIDNLTVRDLTTGTGNITTLCNVINSSASTLSMMCFIRNVILIGRAAKSLVDVGQNGDTGLGDFNLRIDGFVGGLTETLIATQATKTTDFRALISGVWNTSAEVPAMREYTGASLGNTFGRLVDGGGNIGIKKQTGRDDTPGLYNEASSLGGYTLNSQVIGDAFIYAGFLPDATTVELPAYGAVPGSARFWAGSPDYGAVGEYTTPPSSNTITTVQASVGLTMGSGGVDPGGLDLSMWKTSGGTRLTVKNASGSGRYFVVKTLG